VTQVDITPYCALHNILTCLCVTVIDTSKIPYQVANPEVVYYFERLFEPIVVATLRRNIAQLPTQYTLLPPLVLSSRSQSAIAVSRQANERQMLYRFNEVRMVLEGTRKRYAPGQEILKRAKKKIVEPVDTPFVLCQVNGCSRIADAIAGKCPDCQIIRCCSLEHFAHANHSQLPCNAAAASNIMEPPPEEPRGRGEGRGGRGGRGRGARGRGARSDDERDIAMARLEQQVQELRELLVASQSSSSSISGSNKQQ
jgi:hypothetical protein